jgi:nucleotide-binding universal stress UspA family protein
MKLEFKTILVATDLTHSGSSALQYAKRIAKLHGATLVVVHAIDPTGYAFPQGLPQTTAIDQTAREALGKIEDEAREQGIAVHSVVETSVIYERILQAVADHHADLLVLGTRAASRVGRAALGTVARRLLATAPCPILTVPTSADTDPQRVGRWQRVLVATDFSAASLAALAHAQNITASQLYVVHATTDPMSENHRRHLEMLRFLAPFNESHTVPVEHFVTCGEAGKVIAGHAGRLHPDLIVLGSPLTELQDDDFLTSTVLQVVAEATCPVLCVPPVGNTSATEMIGDLAFSHSS